AGEIRLDPVELPSRHDGSDVQLAGAIAGELGVLIGDEKEFHRVEASRGVVPVIMIADGENVGILYPLLEHVRAVGHHDTGAGVGIAMRGEGWAMDRTG